MDTKKSPLKRLLFLFLPFIFLFVYDISASLVAVIIERGLTLLSVSDKFLSSSASFMDASIAFVLSIICYIFYRIVFTKREPEVRISKPTGVIYAIILGFGAGGISSLWLNGVYILIHLFSQSKLKDLILYIAIWRKARIYGYSLRLL